MNFTLSHSLLSSTFSNLFPLAEHGWVSSSPPAKSCLKSASGPGTARLSHRARAGHRGAAIPGLFLKASSPPGAAEGGPAESSVRPGAAPWALTATELRRGLRSSLGRGAAEASGGSGPRGMAADGLRQQVAPGSRRRRPLRQRGPSSRGGGQRPGRRSAPAAAALLRLAASPGPRPQAEPRRAAASTPQLRTPARPRSRRKVGLRRAAFGIEQGGMRGHRGGA